VELDAAGGCVQVDVRITRRIIEVFHHAKRVAAHQRRYGSI
jgi:hypothetical protein